MLPRHIAIIPDGNRRWARQNGIPVSDVYGHLLNKVSETLVWLRDQGIKEVSAFAASQENINNRSKLEISGLMHAVRKMSQEVVKIPGVGVHIFGDIAGLPDWAPGKKELLELQKSKRVQEGDMRIHVGLNYSGNAEDRQLLEAVEKEGLEPVKNDPEKYLLSADVPPVDLLIRTGGQRRLSGFLPHQLEYAELWFTDTFWPDFDKTEFQGALSWYAEQKRNFGA